MDIAWGKLWQASRGRLKTGWLITAGLVAIYIGAIEPMNRREITTQRETGLGAVTFDSKSMWHQMRPMHALLYKAREGVAGVAGRGGFGAARGLDYVASSIDALPAPPPPPPVLLKIGKRFVWAPWT